MDYDTAEPWEPAVPDEPYPRRREMDFKVQIEVKNVAKGDIAHLCQEILDSHGENFDARRGEFVIRTYEVQGNSAFEYDWEKDDD